MNRTVAGLAAGPLVITHLRKWTVTCTPSRSKLATFQSHMFCKVAR
jgi:hypothetical protein